ncbi:carbohydrate ABC transporter permease [Clostridium fallax]|uniref:Carbohydrate ABC transporter membrane protein 1, CUT1 family n=1 Tax=Clostridium fallax TaxID=1533 RepID=A0A1M4XVA2_9CLOT|nr:sugar ABC transporter permease [Clostridium fallax]SHE97421.1 carbohydrate ABC transporter membrane protein 1, CUT1 family [Clostridium fallax]SQB06517.1 carbohydrate ABC transporter membrane protein 1, CUT1 family (TC 3.A.1.1.-) [Clostridium fallax]
MNKKNLTSWILLIPVSVIMLFLVVYPIFKTFLFSLDRFNLTEPGNIKFIGLKNYIKVFKSGDFYYSLINSLIIIAFVIILGFTCSLLVGLLLNKKSRLSPVLTAIAIIPWALPPVVNGIIWKFIFYPGYGLANKILINSGLINEPITWTTNRYILMIVISIVVAWRVIPFCAIVVLANLQTIPSELYEAAKVDGATKVKEFFEITLPLILPSLTLILINLTISAINVFDEIVALNGYAFEGQTLLIYNYMNTFSFMNFGLGSAITYIIMILSGIIGYFYIRTMSKDII